MQNSERVEVYRNLHKNCFSVRALTGENKGKVIDPVQEITLKDVKFAVQPAGRKRVLKEKQKNVHAFIRGIPTEEPLEPSLMWDKAPYSVRYDPYVNESFIMKYPQWTEESMKFLYEDVYQRRLMKRDGGLLPPRPNQTYKTLVIKEAKKAHLSFTDDGHSRIEVLP